MQAKAGCRSRDDFHAGTHALTSDSTDQETKRSFTHRLTGPLQTLLVGLMEWDEASFVKKLSRQAAGHQEWGSG